MGKEKGRKRQNKARKKEMGIQIEFQIADSKIQETPRGAAILIKQMIEKFGLVKIARDLEMEKHHGVKVEEILLILILYSSYGVSSIKQLEEKAQKDLALAAVIEDIQKINEKMILYFQNRNEPEVFEDFLDEVIRKIQKNPKLKSKAEGILAVDDTSLVKTGKKMEKIEIIYDHGTKKYVLGYVVVTVSYADSEKAYPVNFEFRLKSEEEKLQAQLETEKKKEKIDLREKGSLLEMLKLQEKQGQKADWTDVTGHNLEALTLKTLDEKQIDWVGIPNGKTKLLDQNQKPWNYETLKTKTQKNKPMELEFLNWNLYSKKVLLPEYGELELKIVQDKLGNELGIFLLKPAEIKSQTDLLQNYFSKQEVSDSNKLKIALQGIQQAKEAGIQAETVAADAWFFVAWFIQAVLRIPGIKRFVSRLKSNCPIYYQNQWIQVSQLWDILPLRFVRGKYLKIASISASIKGLPFPVRIVFFQELDKSLRIKAQYILCCTDVSWSWKKIIHAYKLRWTIECFFRTAKQSFGLQSFHHRKFNEIFCHVTFSFLSFLLLTQLKFCHPKLIDLTLGQIIQRYLNCLIVLKKYHQKLIIFLNPDFAAFFGIPDG